MYPSNLNSFPVIRTASAKNRNFHVPQPTFLFPLETPLRLSRNMLHGWKEFNACQTPRSMYPSVFNSLPVIRSASAKTRRFHVPQPTFLFPLEMPLRLSPNMFRGWKDTSMLAKPLATSTFNSFRVIRCLSQCVSPKIAIFTKFWFPLGTPLG